MICGEYSCPVCGDKLVHQTNRGFHESSSALGQWVHDKLPRRMNFVDVDAVVHARNAGTLRFIEHKNPGKGLSRSQKEMLPIIVAGIGLAADLLLGGLRDRNESGVFIVECQAPFDGAKIIDLTTDISANELYGRIYQLEGDDWHRFMTGRPVIRPYRELAEPEPYEKLVETGVFA